MSVTKALGVVLMVLAACDPGSRDEPKHDELRSDGPHADAYVFPDAAPPPFDAAPLPEMACTPADAGMQCPLPPSRCLDSHYLIYYTNGSCVDDKCTFSEQWTFCSSGCMTYGDPQYGAGCSGGFT